MPIVVFPATLTVTLHCDLKTNPHHYADSTARALTYEA